MNVVAILNWVLGVRSVLSELQRSGLRDELELKLVLEHEFKKSTSTRSIHNTKQRFNRQHKQNCTKPAIKKTTIVKQLY